MSRVGRESAAGQRVGGVRTPPTHGGGASSPLVGGAIGGRRWRGEGVHCALNVGGGGGGRLRGSVEDSLT